MVLMLSEMLHPEVEEKTLSSVMRADKIRGEEWRAANPLDFMKVKVKGGPAIGKAVHEQRAANREILRPPPKPMETRSAPKRGQRARPTTTGRKSDVILHHMFRDGYGSDI